MWGLDKKIIKIYADLEKKTIAWRELSGKWEDLSKLQSVRQLKKQQARQIIISVGKMLKAMGVQKTDLPMKNIPVLEYNDQIEKHKYKIIDLREFLKYKKAEPAVK